MRLQKLAVFLIPFSLGCGSETRIPDQAVPTTTARVTLQIGSLEGDGPSVFGRIGGLLEDEGGRIFVLDYQASDIRVFMPTGEHRFTFGREGSGPGEMLNPCCMAWDPTGRLWVRDGNNHRYSAYTVEADAAQFVEQREMAHSDINFWAPVTFRDNRTLIDVGHRSGGSGDLELARFFITSEGLEGPPEVAPSYEPSELGQHSVMRSPSVRMYLHQPFGPRELVAHGPAGAWAYGLSSDYDLTAQTSLGPVPISRPVVGPPLSERERVAAGEQMDSQANRAGLRARDLPFNIPDRKTPVRAIFYDSSGNLWVERQVPDGEPRVADVWTPDGELTREIRWPADVNLNLPGWVGSTSALGIRTDPLGVQYVVRIEF